MYIPKTALDCWEKMSTAVKTWLTTQLLFYCIIEQNIFYDNCETSKVNSLGRFSVAKYWKQNKDVRHLVANAAQYSRVERFPARFSLSSVKYELCCFPLENNVPSIFRCWLIQGGVYILTFFYIMQGGMTSCTEESLNVIVNTVPLDTVVCQWDKHQRFVEDMCED